RLSASGDVRFAEIGDEVLDIAGSDLGERTIAEVLEDRPQTVIDRLPDRELLCEDVPFLVDLGELPQCQRLRLAWRFDAAFVERAVANRVLQVIEHALRFGLGLDLAIRPLFKGDADVTEARPPGVRAAIPRASLVHTELVQPHGLLLTRVQYSVTGRPRVRPRHGAHAV